MADFRKWLYALAVVALLAGLTVPASAQTTVVCTVQSATDNLIRTQGYTEQVGDVVVACTGGVPTPNGQIVPSVNIQLFLSLNVTSQITASSSAGNFLDALLIVDEPNSASNPTVQIENCGVTGTNELTGSGESGPGVCAITATGVPTQTYNGTAGHPNVFQGRQALGSLQNTSVVFQGVPFDPPGSGTRFLRFTNVRVNANQLGVSAPTAQIPILMGITSSGSASLPLSFLSLAVATAQNGLTVGTAAGPVSFAQCVGNNAGLLKSSAPFATCSVSGVCSGSGASVTAPFLAGTPVVRFSEGFSSSWKPKNITQTLANGVASTASGDGYLYGNTTLYPADLNQNVPGVNYFTESGFEYISTTSNPVPNPPIGFQTGFVAGGVSGDTGPGSNAFTDPTTGIAAAGIATQGTRLALALSNLPGGVSVFVPPVIYLYRQGTNYTSSSTINNGTATGVAVLTATDSQGNTGYNPASNLSNLQLVSQSNGGALIVYEILFTDPYSNEYLDVPIVAAYAPNLSSNPPLGLPQPGVTAAYQGGFAPFYSASGAFVAASESSYPIPRFYFQAQGGTLFSVNRCSCNLLFPFVTQQYGYDTGIAIANTSTDPFGAATPQEGVVTFNYYGVVGVNSPPPTAQTSSTSTPVASGTVLLYTLSQGNTALGLDNRGANFTGYLITQAQFQYCHGFAFISALGAGPTNAGISEGYLALVLDAWGLPVRGTLLGESLGQ